VAAAALDGPGEGEHGAKLYVNHPMRVSEPERLLSIKIESRNATAAGRFRRNVFHSY
jgi:hypothetical protein